MITPMDMSHAPVVFPNLSRVSRAFAATLAHDRSAYRQAFTLVVQKNVTFPYRLLPGTTAVIAPLSAQLPEAATTAIHGVVQQSRAGLLILSGGRTNDLPPASSEALVTLERLRRYHPYETGVRLETRSTHTRENFLHMAADFGDEIAACDHLIFLSHQAHTRRVMMTARQVFGVDTGLMSVEAFNSRAISHGYRSELPEHSPYAPSDLAHILAKLKVYSAAGHILPTPQEADLLEKLYTRAREYASTSVHDRKPAYA